VVGFLIAGHKEGIVINSEGNNNFACYVSSNFSRPFRIIYYTVLT